MKNPEEMTPEELVEYLEANGFNAERRAEAERVLMAIRRRLELAVKIERIESVLRKLIVWLVAELGEENAKTLLAELNNPAA